jgi:hypothetical protein
MMQCFLYDNNNMSGIPKIHTGARAIVKINNELMVYALAVQYQVVTEYKPIQGIDNPLPEELAPVNIEVSCILTNLRVPRQSASILALQPTMLNLMHQGYVSIEIRDRVTNDVMLYIPKAMLIKRTGAISARATGGETWFFVGIGYWDERDPEKASVGVSNSPNLVELAKKF